MQERWLAHLEKLAALDLCEGERTKLRADLTRIIQFAESLPECSLEDVATSPQSYMKPPAKKKDPDHSFSREKFIAGAPHFVGDFIVVPQVLDPVRVAEDD